MRKQLGAAIAAASLSLTFATAPAPAEAASINYCTHTTSRDGIINLTTVTYRSGRWSYVGSVLTHIHTYDMVTTSAITGQSSYYYGLQRYCYS